MTDFILPQELIDNIIDQLHDNRPTLKSCALVCKSWLPCSRFHIFCHVSLQPPQNNIFGFAKITNCQRLYRIIETSPQIVPYIRDLTICEGNVYKAWMGRETTLPLLLRMLRNLRRLELERSASMRMANRDMPPNLRDSIMEVLRLPSLTELKLVGFVSDTPAKFLRMFRFCQNLKVLRLSHVVCADDGAVDDSTGAISQRAQLDVLSIGPRTSPTVVGSLLLAQSPIDLSSICQLNLSISCEFATFAKLLRVTPVLEHLEIDLMSDVDLEAYWSIPDRLNIGHHPRLRSVEVKIDVLTHQHDPLPWLHALFSTVESYNCLEEIRLIYSIFLPSPYMDRPVRETEFRAWKDIDSLLAQPSFSSLRHVRLGFALENPIGSGVAPRFLDQLTLHSPALESRGILSVDAWEAV